VENGHGRTLDYRAHLRLSDGRRMRTTICDVRSGATGFERWTDPISTMELEDFTLRSDGHAGAPPTCD